LAPAARAAWQCDHKRLADVDVAKAGQDFLPFPPFLAQLRPLKINQNRATSLKAAQSTEKTKAFQPLPEEPFIPLKKILLLNNEKDLLD
jgi:hypothetical protein